MQNRPSGVADLARISTILGYCQYLLVSCQLSQSTATAENRPTARVRHQASLTRAQERISSSPQARLAPGRQEKLQSLEALQYSTRNSAHAIMIEKRLHSEPEADGTVPANMTR